MTMAKIETEPLQARWRAWRREFALSALADGGARWIAATAGAWLAVAALDAAFALPLAVRWAAFFLLTATAAGSFYFYMIVPLGRLRPLAVLRKVSGRHPELKPFLVPAWELSYGGGCGPHTSAALARAHLEQTGLELGRMAGSKAVVPGLSKSARRSLAYLAASAAILGPWLWRAEPGLSRILAPWREIPLDSWVEVSPGNARVPWGIAATILAGFKPGKGGPALEGAGLALWLREESGAWGRAAWDREDRRQYSYRAEHVTHRLDYQLRWRDQRGSVYSIEPVPSPQLEKVHVRLRLPGARGLSSQEAAETELDGAGEVSGLDGSWVGLSGRPNMPLAKAQIVVSYLNAPVELKPGPGGIYEAGFPLTQEGSFHFELVSRDGIGDPRPVEYRLKVLADEPPTVELLSPAFEITASPQDPLPVTYEAHDDYGLTGIDLIYRAGGQERARTVQRFARPPLDRIGDYSWDLSAFPAGETVEFQIRALDNHVPRPQSAVSKKGIVHLADFQAGHDALEKHWLSTEERLDRLVESETHAERILRELSRPSSAAQAERLKNELEDRERDLAEQWPQAQRSLDEMAESMDRDPYSNRGMAQQARSLADEFKSVRESQWSKAAESSAAGRWDEAGRRHGTLKAEALKAKRLLSEGKHLQAMQDLWSDARRMEQGGEDIAAALEGMAERKPGSPTAQERRALDDALSKLARAIDELKKTIESMPKPPPGSPSDAKQKAYVVPLNAARQAANALQQALQAGDFASAARMARQLSEELSRVREAIADAARSSASSGPEGGEGPEMPSKKMDAAAALWQQAIDAQSKSLGAAQKLDEERVQALLKAQKGLLDSLARRQKAAADEAWAAGSGVQPEVLGWMDGVLGEFSSKAVLRSPQWLAQIARRLESQELALPRDLKSQAEALARIAGTEQKILDDLTRGVPVPPPGESERSQAAAADALQREARGKAAELQGRLEALRSETATMPESLVDSVVSAQQEQTRALDDIKGFESASAVKHEDKALELLDQGMKGMSSAIGQQKKIEDGMTSSFASSQGGRPGTARAGRTGGADTGFVRLPSAKDYKPPEEIRRNLEQSLDERRPKSYDAVIKDYFKRISQ